MMRRAFLTALLALAALAMAAPAAAADLDRLRAQGVIAERYDGYVEVRPGEGSASAEKVVEEVNAKRRRIYKKRAESQGVPVEQVGRVYAEQILERLPEGAWFRKPDGSYVRK